MLWSWKNWVITLTILGWIDVSMYWGIDYCGLHTLDERSGWNVSVVYPPLFCEIPIFKLRFARRYLPVHCILWSINFRLYFWKTLIYFTKKKLVWPPGTTFENRTWKHFFFNLRNCIHIFCSPFSFPTGDCNVIYCVKI